MRRHSIGEERPRTPRQRLREFTSCLFTGLALVFLVTAATMAEVAAGTQSDPVVVSAALLDAQTDGVTVRGRLSISVVNVSGAVLSDVTLRLDRPSPGALVNETIGIEDLEPDATGVAAADVVVDQSFVASSDPFVFRVTYVGPAGERSESVVAATRSAGGGL